MPLLKNQLDLDRCPYCSVETPSLINQTQIESIDYTGQNHRFWRFYKCARCGGITTAASTANWDTAVTEMYPSPSSVSETIPEPARRYLKQALQTLHSPDGSLHNIGIPDWHSAIGTLRSIDSLHVPAILLQRN